MMQPLQPYFDTIERLIRGGHLGKTLEYIQTHFITLCGDPEAFGKIIAASVTPRLVAKGKLELETVANDLVTVWQLAEMTRHYPVPGVLADFEELILRAYEYSRGLETAITVAAKHPRLPGAQELLRLQSGTKKIAQDRRQPIIRFERKVAVTSYLPQGGSWRSTGTSSGRTSLLRSPQERAFMKAARHFFVGREVLPNVPLRNFINIEELIMKLPRNAIPFGKFAEADILIASPVDFDPLGVIELDSSEHDLPVAKRRDLLKDKILEKAEIPIVRIRVENPATITSDDFFEILCMEASKFSQFQLAHWRERETHPLMVPVAS